MTWRELHRLHCLPLGQRERIGRLLRAAPWLVPTDSEPMALQVSRHFPDLTSAPPARGCVPLLSVCEGSAGTLGDLWALLLGETATGDGQFDHDALRLWRGLADELPRYVPLVLSSVRELGRIGIGAFHVERATRESQRPPVAVHAPPLTLVGSSFGLSFVIAQVSWLLDVAPPDDLAASAAVVDGYLEPVDGIGAKVSALLAGSSRIRRLLVAKEKGIVSPGGSGGNAAEAHHAARQHGRDLNVMEVEKVEDAVRIAYPNLTNDALSAFKKDVLGTAGQTPLRIRRACERLLNMALATDAWMKDWTPLRRAADLLLHEWDDTLSDVDKWLLALVIAISRRHHGEDIPVTLPTDGVLRELADDLQLRVAATLVQQAHDSDDMEIPSVVEFAERYLAFVPPTARTLSHLKVRGALARLRRLSASLQSDEDKRATELAACADEQKAIIEELGLLALQGASPLQEASFQISELFLLASLIDRANADNLVRSAATILQELQEHIVAPGLNFVEWARARANLALGIDLDSTASTLDRLASDAQSPALHLRRSASRLRARLLRLQGRADEADDECRRLASLPTGDGDSGQVFRLLAEIDRWEVAGQASSEEARLVVGLDELCSARTRQMMGFGRFVRDGTGAGRDRLLRLRQFFPY